MRDKNQEKGIGAISQAHAAQRQKDREGRESNQAAKQPGCHESTMARTGQRIMARRWVQQCIEAVADHVQNSHGSRASALSSTRRAVNAPLVRQRVRVKLNER